MKTTKTKTKTTMTETVESNEEHLHQVAELYLSKPYARRLTPDPSGGFVASIQEFRGCVAEGDSADEALDNLHRAAWSWIVSQLSHGQTVPEPIAFDGYSGKLALRMPRGIHKQAAELAAAENTSLNQLLVAAISSYVGANGVANVVLNEFRRRVEQVVYVACSNVTTAKRYTGDTPLMTAHAQACSVIRYEGTAAGRAMKMIGAA